VVNSQSLSGLKPDNFTQDDNTFQALFSNNNGSTKAGSWQLDSHKGDITLRSEGNAILSYSTSNLSPNIWYHAIIRKEDISGTTRSSVFITALEDSIPSLIMSQDTDIGDLQMFRIGTNRNTKRFFRMDVSNLKIYDDSAVDLRALLTEGPQLSAVPEPSSNLFFVLGALALALHRRKH